jgi:hypothetical protein
LAEQAAISQNHRLESVAAPNCRRKFGSYLKQSPVPAIQDACCDGAPSLAKAVRILDAAIPAVSTRLSDKMKAIIRSLT